MTEEKVKGDYVDIDLFKRSQYHNVFIAISKIIVWRSKLIKIKIYIIASTLIIPMSSTFGSLWGSAQNFVICYTYGGSYSSNLSTSP